MITIRGLIKNVFLKQMQYWFHFLC